MPTQSQKPDDQPSPVSQAVQIWGEGPEMVPYAVDFVPPSAFLPGLSGGSGSASGIPGLGGSSTPSSSQVPDPYDLEWVASDTAKFEFFFADVCWVDSEPDVVDPAITWAATIWRSQVRTEGLWYYGYWWPPVYPLGRRIMEFAVTATYVNQDPDLGSGTMVTLTGGSFWPGEFKWDLQSEQYLDPLLPTLATNVRTWLAGKATVRNQVTSPQLVPPSHWPVYEYP